MLYFSAAQLNILSLSVFLANALHATDKSGAALDVILIDDPIQSMDSINVLATIDLLRNVSERFDKQIIISMGSGATAALGAFDYLMREVEN